MWQYDTDSMLPIAERRRHSLVRQADESRLATFSFCLLNIPFPFSLTSWFTSVASEMPPNSIEVIVDVVFICLGLKHK